MFREQCVKWAFSQEEGDKTGYPHYQCRIKLKVRSASAKAAAKSTGIKGHWSLTSSENKDNNFYVVKVDGRVAGPFLDTDQEIYIPRQWRIAEADFYPWQKQIWDSVDTREDRPINVCWNPAGAEGKSTISHLCRLKKRCYMLKNRSTGEQMLQDMLCQLMARRDRSPPGVIVDLTRSTNQKRLKGLYDCLEDIKNGWVTDWRYEFKQWDFDAPVVWVMCNSMPNPAWLSPDRWRFWHLRDGEMFRISHKQAILFFANQANSEEDDDH